MKLIFEEIIIMCNGKLFKVWFLININYKYFLININYINIFEENCI